MIHSLAPEPRTLHGHFSRDLEPVLTIDPGDTVLFSTLDAGWGLEPHAPGTDRREAERGPHDDGHALTGPVSVRGARPGMTLVVEIGELVPGAYGHCVAGDWDSEWNRALDVVEGGVMQTYVLEDGVGTSSLGRRVTLRPFLGVMGMPPAEPGVHSTIPPRACGGNLDCKELVSGVTLHLPIAVEGALFSAGDGHAAQGDGEVSGTAIECPMDRAALTLSLSDRRLAAPLARTPDAWITFGLDRDLDVAAVNALQAMVALIGDELGIGQRDALAVASIEVDMRITQLVNDVRGVHAVWRT